MHWPESEHKRDVGGGMGVLDAGCGGGCSLIAGGEKYPAYGPVSEGVWTRLSFLQKFKFAAAANAEVPAPAKRMWAEVCGRKESFFHLP